MSIHFLKNISAFAKEYYLIWNFIKKSIYISENVCYNQFNKNYRLFFYRFM